MLKALLEPDTWSQAAARFGEEFAAGGTRSRAGGGAAPGGGAREPPAGARAGAAAARSWSRRGARQAEPRRRRPPPSRAPAAEPAARRRPPPTPPPTRCARCSPSASARPPTRPRRAVPLALVGLGVAALIGAAGRDRRDAVRRQRARRSARPDGGGDGTRHFVPEKGGPLAAPFPTEPGETACYSTASIRRSTVLYREPGGAKRLRITPHDRVGLAARAGRRQPARRLARRAGGRAQERRDRLAPARAGALDCVELVAARRPVQAHAARAPRRAHGAQAARRDRPHGQPHAARAASRSPTGCRSPTEARPTAAACSRSPATRPTCRPYWPGGDRLAVHATDDESSIGEPVSLGCMRADAAEARWLINHIPLGSPVFIRT